MMRPIVLLTDFGHRDPFVGIMKGVILSLAPKATVLDLSHGIPPGDVEAAALALRQAVPYFPKRSIFAVVVDPGVGSKRRVVWGRSRKHDFLAPDNGVLTWLQKEDEVKQWREVTNTKLFLAPTSSTFHGRDIFSPVAASLANGLSPEKLGPKIPDPVRLAWPEPKRISHGLEGVILSCDHFGNVVTNIPVNQVPPKARIFHRHRDLGPLRTHYAAVPPGRPLAVTGSAGLIEISTRDGDYSVRSRARRGDPVYVRYRA
ncbi:MAG: SAM-dependent chlorinase/fluorinase [Elusimicrobiota bacterium]